MIINVTGEDGMKQYCHRSVEDVFEEAGVEYNIVSEGDGEYMSSFVRSWDRRKDRMEEAGGDAFADFGKYMAVIDLFVGDKQARDLIYQNIQTDGEYCYIPDTRVWMAEEQPIDDDTEQYQLKSQASQLLEDDPNTINTYQRGVLNAYQEAREEILNSTFKGC